MQGSASVAEGERQPPYLCVVCEGKFVRAVLGVGDVAAKGGKGGKRVKGEKSIGNEGIEEGIRARRRVLREFCERKGNRDVYMFKAFGAWLGALEGAGD
jgi:hypothetical protein